MYRKIPTKAFHKVIEIENLLKTKWLDLNSDEKRKIAREIATLKKEYKIIIDFNSDHRICKNCKYDGRYRVGRVPPCCWCSSRKSEWKSRW